MKYRYRTDEEMKDSGVEWIGKIPRDFGWENMKLKYLIGKVIDNRGRTPEYGVSGIPMLEVKQITNGDKYPDNKFEKFVSEDIAKKFIREDVEEGDILISTVGATSGKAVMVGENPNYFIAQNVIGFRIKESFEKNFLYYALISNYFTSSLKSINKSNTIDNLKVSIFISNVCVIPTNVEQKKIAQFLDKKISQFDLIISKKEALIEKLEEAKKSLINEVVTGKVKVIKTDDGYDIVQRSCEEMKDSRVEWIGLIPKEWSITKLKYNLSKIGSGKTPKGGAEVYTDSGVVFIRSQNVYNSGLQLNDVVYISKEIDNEMNNSKVKFNDVLLNITGGGSIGRCCVVKDQKINANVNQHVCILRPIIENINPELLAAVVQSDCIQYQIQSKQNASNREGLNFEQIGDFIFVKPNNKKEQNILAEYLEGISEETYCIKGKIVDQIQKLKEARQSLITEAVTGKIEILD